jgi:hypothetical protein
MLPNDDRPSLIRPIPTDDGALRNDAPSLPDEPVDDDVDVDSVGRLAGLSSCSLLYCRTCWRAANANRSCE